MRVVSVMVCVLAKCTEELVQLCDEALHRNLDVIAGSPELNLVCAAVRNDATSVGNSTEAASESDIQACVADILERHQMILRHLLANQQTKISTTEPDDPPLAFMVTQVSNTVNVTNQNGRLLQTMDNGLAESMMLANLLVLFHCEEDLDST